MAVHLTPTELAREHGLSRADVLNLCVMHGVPVVNGRIDRTLFALACQPSEPQQAPVTAS